MSKALKGIGIIKKLSRNLPRHSLVTIYKSFVRPHLDYGDIIYDQPNNESFTQKIERIQYNAALAITGAIKGTSQSKLYSELGFESQKFKRCFRKNWKTRILTWHYSKNQSSIQYSPVRRCYNILQQNWCFQVLLFPIYNIRMEQTW